MAQAAKTIQDNLESTEFAALLEESMEHQAKQGSVVKGRIIEVQNDAVIIDVGLKSEGRVSLREFTVPGQESEIRVGDEVDVFVDRMEDRNGETVLSREKARREEAWFEMEASHKKNERVTGNIFGRVKGGFTVDLGGAVAFLPGSQVDIRPVRDVTPLMGTPQPFLILKMDRQRGNIVVSRRAVLEESREDAKSEMMENIKEGSVVQGIVKNITDYGAFIDLGGVDGLLHVTDVSWKRVNHPSEVLQVGETVDVQIIRFNQETGRISLGMKQLETDPWEGAVSKYPVKGVFKGRVTNITDYGAFVELEDGIEGLVHVSEMSWTKKNVHPGQIISTSEEVEIMVLEVDMDKRRISLGIKQCQDNPWASFGDNHKVGDELEGEVNNVTEFGLFVAVDANIDGMVHLSDISWEDQTEDALKAFKKSDKVKVKILDIDPEKERVALGIKQLSDDPFEGAMKGMAKGSVVTCTISEVKPTIVEVTVNDGVTGIIKKADLSRERSEQRTDRFAVGEKVDAKVISVDQKNRKVTLSIKAREMDEDKQALETFGSTESGASLGDILGAALSSSKTAEPAEEEKEKPKAKKAATKKAPAKKAAKKSAKKDDAEEAKDAE